MKLVRLGYSVWRNILGFTAGMALILVVLGINIHTHVVSPPNPARPVASKEIEWNACHRYGVQLDSPCWIEWTDRHKDARVRRPVQ